MAKVRLVCAIGVPKATVIPRAKNHMRNRVLCTFALLLLSISTGPAPSLLRARDAAVGSPEKKSAFLSYNGVSDMVGNIDISIWDAYKRHFIAGFALFTM